jgi:hypothetical protein
MKLFANTAVLQKKIIYILVAIVVVGCGKNKETVTLPPVKVML